MRFLLAAVFFLLPLAPSLADPQAEAAMRAMEALRAQWQALADTGAILVARCERGGFHGRRLGPDSRVEAGSVAKPGEPFLGVVRITAAIDSNGSSPRANAVPVPGARPPSFVCFNTPAEARQATEQGDFTIGNPRRPIFIRPQLFEGFYRIENGTLVLTGGNAAMQERIIATFDPDLQAAGSAWGRVMRFPFEEK